jgi:hypothetical protein
MDTMLFINARMEGIDLNPLLEDLKSQKELELQTQQAFLEDKLVNKTAKVNDVAIDLLREVAEIDIFEAANLQKDNIKKTLDASKPVLQKYEDKLAISKKGLSEMEQQTIALRDELNDLNRQLKKAEGQYPLCSFILNCGKKMCGDQSSEGRGS